MSGANNCDVSGDIESVQSSLEASTLDRANLERVNRSVLEAELLGQSFLLTPGPYYASVQFTNYCNMSCIMCWNGRNPKAKRMPEELIEKFGAQIAPHISILEPNSGSEPLADTWSETREMATKYGLQLVLTTNAQYLDETRFEEIQEITESLCMSLDCSIPEIYSKIRLQADTDAVFENVVRSARLAREQGIECQVNIVLMAINAPHLIETIQFVHEIGIESVNVIQMVHSNRDAYYIDAMEHCSADLIANLRTKAIAWCHENQMRLCWRVNGTETYDSREGVQRSDRQKSSQHWNWRMKRVHPGFCEYAYNRVSIGVQGEIKPCGYANIDQLNLGNLADSDFETDIWNGLNAQDLRRGMYCDDVPKACENCRMHQIPGPAVNMYFLQDVMQDPKWVKDFFSIKHKSLDLPVVSKHGSRYRDVPDLQFKTSFRTPQALLAFAIGGESHLIGGKHSHVESAIVDLDFDDAGVAHVQFPEKMWNCLKPNVGYWWTAWQVNEEKTILSRTSKIQCFVRHQHLPRLEGSQLKYRACHEQPALEK